MVKMVLIPMLLALLLALAVPALGESGLANLRTALEAELGDSKRRWRKCKSNMVRTDCLTPEPCRQACGKEEGICATVCSGKGCQCPPDLPVWDEEANKCVESQDACTTKNGSGSCPSNLVYSECGPPKGCWPQCGEEPRICIQMCVPGCRCPEDKPIYDEASNSCFSEENCPVIVA